jgi:hypothetical protein
MHSYQVNRVNTTALLCMLSLKTIHPDGIGFEPESSVPKLAAMSTAPRRKEYMVYTEMGQAQLKTNLAF